MNFMNNLTTSMPKIENINIRTAKLGASIDKKLHKAQFSGGVFKGVGIGILRRVSKVAFLALSLTESTTKLAFAGVTCGLATAIGVVTVIPTGIYALSTGNTNPLQFSAATLALTPLVSLAIGVIGISLAVSSPIVAVGVTIDILAPELELFHKLQTMS